MNPTLMRICALLLAVAAVSATIYQVTSRVERTWPVEPTWPPTSPMRAHWFYRTFDALPAENARLGIWGWAAHAWVYTGTIPATRETSAEFAWRDWGRDSYYRKRYMAALVDHPPEYFIVTVGPNQFMFSDRRTHGPQTLPELPPFLERLYVTVLDDGETTLMMRRDAFDACCGLAKRIGQDGSAPGGEWIRYGQGSASGPVDSHWQVESAGPARLLAIPFRVGKAPGAGSTRLGLAGPDGTMEGCDQALAGAVPGATTVCLIEQPAGTGWKVAGRSDGTDADDWIEVGRPFLVRNPGDGS